MAGRQAAGAVRHARRARVLGGAAMKYCRFRHHGVEGYGALIGEQVAVLPSAPWEQIPSPGPSLPLDSVQLLVPSLASKVVAIGQNYRKHAEEMGKPVPAQPLIFLKPS